LSKTKFKKKTKEMKREKVLEKKPYKAGIQNEAEEKHNGKRNFF